MYQNILEGWHHSQISDLGLGWGPRICISNKFSGKAADVGLGTILQESLFWRDDFHWRDDLYWRNPKLPWEIDSLKIFQSEDLVGSCLISHILELYPQTTIVKRKNNGVPLKPE